MSATCPRCDAQLVWNDGWGYRCPTCYMFVAIPKQGGRPKRDFEESHGVAGAAIRASRQNSGQRVECPLGPHAARPSAQFQPGQLVRQGGGWFASLDPRIERGDRRGKG